MGAGREVEHEANPCSELGEMLSGRRGRDASFTPRLMRTWTASAATRWPQTYTEELIPTLVSARWRELATPAAKAVAQDCTRMRGQRSLKPSFIAASPQMIAIDCVQHPCSVS